MLRRSGLAWVAAGLALGLVLAATRRLPPGPAAEASASAPPPVAAPRSAATAGVVLDGGGAGRTAAEPQRERPVAEHERAGAGGAPPAREPGRVTGVVTRPDGTPLGNALVVLVPGEPAAGRREARTDALGEFAFERVPVGAWTLEHRTQAPPVYDAMIGSRRTLAVAPGRETWVPVQLEGQRSLSGRLTMNLAGLDLAGQGGFVLLLELRPRHGGGAPVASARVHALNRPLWERAPATRDELSRALAEASDPRLAARVDPDDPDTWPRGEEPGWIAGAFRFEHLPADEYVLRIALEDNRWVTTTIDGQRLRLELWLEREADLTAGDLELVPEELDLHADFLRAAYERHLEGQARNPPAPPTAAAEEP